MVEDGTLILAVVVVSGLAHHFVLAAEPQDLRSRLQRAVPFLYWITAGVLITAAVTLVYQGTSSIAWTTSTAVVAMTAGVILSQLLVEALRERQTQQASAQGYTAALVQKEEGSSGEP